VKDLYSFSFSLRFLPTNLFYPGKEAGDAEWIHGCIIDVDNGASTSKASMDGNYRRLGPATRMGAGLGVQRALALGGGDRS